MKRSSMTAGSAFSSATACCRIRGPEQIIETYYGFPLSFWRVTFDYQFIANPGYNSDRGPVSVLGARLHAQF